MAFVLNNAMSATSPNEPLKRKRGRPPKNNKMAEAFPTLTLQFHTSPDAGSPTAESNSNMTVKMGEPDTFTPLMKVSPRQTSSRKKRQRSSVVSMSSAGDDSPLKKAGSSKETNLLTPMSVSSYTSLSSFQINPKALDNISFITNTDVLPPLLRGFPLATPPHSTVRPHFSNAMSPSGTGQSMGSPTLNMGMGYHTTANMGLGNPTSVNMGMGRPEMSLNSMHMIPINTSLHNTANSAMSTNKVTHPPAANTNLSLAQGFERKAKTTTTTAREKVDPISEVGKASNLVNFINDGMFLFRLVVDDLGRAVLSPSEEPRVEEGVDDIEFAEILIEEETSNPVVARPGLPKLVHAHTAIGIEANYHSRDDLSSRGVRKRMLSEPNKPTDDHIVPQTPKGEFYFSSGYTPMYMSSEANGHGDCNLAYNLTPQFNSMMYSMMNLNSPQQKKSLTLQQPFLNQQPDLANQSSKFSGPAQGTTIDMNEFLGTGGPSNGQYVNSPSADDEDARAALKKVIKKRR